MNSNRGFQGLVITIVVAFVLTLLMFFVLFTPLPGANDEVIPGPGPPDWEETRQRMSYHGTLSAEMNVTTGEVEFWREGMKCRLW